MVKSTRVQSAINEDENAMNCGGRPLVTDMVPLSTEESVPMEESLLDD